MSGIKEESSSSFEEVNHRLQTRRTALENLTAKIAETAEVQIGFQLPRTSVRGWTNRQNLKDFSPVCFGLIYPLQPLKCPIDL